MGTRIPAPCYLVLAGLAVGFAPHIEGIRLPPQLVFYGFLPPLLYAAAFLTSPRDVRRNWLSILLLAVGLTAASLFAVAGAAWGAVAALGASGAFLLGYAPNVLACGSFAPLAARDAGSGSG